MLFFYSNCQHVASNSGRDRCTFVNLATQIALVPACSAHIHERLNMWSNKIRYYRQTRL